MESDNIEGINKKKNMENEQNEVNNLKKYGGPFQSKCLGILVSDRVFLERIVDILSPDYFETDAHKWIVKFVMEYFPKYREIPTAAVFAVEIQKMSDNVLQAAIKEQVKAAYRQVSAADLTYVKEQFLEFCKTMKLKNAIWESNLLLKRGDFEGIWNVINEASKAGIERNLGHDYFADFDARMSEAARETVKTGWDLVDGHLDGGLGKGELGFIVAPAGSGKCVGPNTEIEIKYMETGIPFKGNSGKEYVIWIKPFDKFNFDGKLLFGWQIDNIFFEIEKMKLHLLEQENMQKK